MPALVKKNQILESATPLFLKKGYRLVSMDKIAQDAHVSKATLYSHFQTKTDLYETVIQNQCQPSIASLRTALTRPLTFSQKLVSFGIALFDISLSEDNQNLYRRVVGDSDVFPELGRIFYRAGPEKVKQLLKDFLHHECPHITKENLAEIFLSLLQVKDMWLQVVLRIQTFSADDRRAKAQEASAVFLKVIENR